MWALELGTAGSFILDVAWLLLASRSGTAISPWSSIRLPLCSRVHTNWHAAVDAAPKGSMTLMPDDRDDGYQIG